MTSRHSLSRGRGSLFLILILCMPFLLAEGGGGGGDAGGEKKEKKAKKSDDHSPKPLPWEIPREAELGCEDEEILLLRDLRLRARELDRRETALGEREAALRNFEKETAETLSKLEGVRAEIIKILEEQQEAVEERVASLAKVVDGMKAKDAAAMLAGIEEGIALQLLQRIKAKQAGKILGAMPPKRAQKLAEKMAELPPEIQNAAGGAANAGERGQR